MSGAGRSGAPARSGLVVVDKPGGMTSHDVVARVRRLARTRKVGHAGTLDPMATGVLLVGVEKATRLLGHLALAEKQYDATVRLGVATTTDDAEGEPTGGAGTRHLTAAEVEAAFGPLTGAIQQVPSTVSAVKVDGRRAHARVRAGEQVELAARPVTVHELTVLGLRHEGDVLDVDVRVRCSSGTYVRALARDAGAALAVGGHLTALRRTAVGAAGRSVTLADAVPLAELEAADEVRLLDLGEAARRFFAVVEVDEQGARAVGHGRPLDLEAPAPAGAPFGVLGPDGRLLALYSGDGSGPVTPVAVLV
ncbi:MAG: tRNA pseudouridine(55) synthase [uncultured Nocardioidaceae bacterium]|uniref:tRNA pseudouridine synthase B n=1 Tax=uncultured Nocardioidaceae bacterium TaxID=253824 RepID=A0A6J4MN69_9ACTN|nr:MAG: tRNA pseudouridine(55) synthase [uncultured Nocardioidaceae bacterium]